MELIYSEVDEYLVFLPRAKALQLEGVHLAINEASTWGELRQLLVEDLYDGLVVRLHEDQVDDEDMGEDAEIEAWEPDPGEALDALNEIVTDGDYPDWPAHDALHWVPDDIQRRFGRVAESVLNGDYLELAPKHEAAIVAAFAQHGFTCTRDDAQVRRAHGFE